ncbi:DnaJ domain-containing protein, partial [Pseudoalteromonas sp. SR45-5]
KLPENFTLKNIQKRWRQLALQMHPDKPNGCEVKFKKIKLQYEQLKVAAR